MALSQALEDHFRAPRHAGRLARPSGRGTAENASCGDVVAIEVAIESEVVAEAAFLAQGCAATIACASYVVAKARGAPRRDLAPGGEFDPDRLLAEAGETQPTRRHGMVLAVRALRIAAGVES
jgi:hypothetical protein